MTSPVPIPGQNPAPDKKHRILIVEDNAIIARLLEANLLIWGYEVAALAASGLDAIARAETTAPDLVLMDITLKGDMDGIQAAGQIRQRFNLPLIFLTAHSDKDTYSRAQRVEPAGYLTKPFEDHELRACIEAALVDHRQKRRGK